MRRLQQLRRARDERGMTLIEMVVTVALTAVVMTLTTVIIVNVLSETNAERQTVVGVEQAQISERSFTQWLRSASQLLYVAPNDLVFQTYSGTSEAGGVPTGIPLLQTVEAELCPTSSPAVSSLEIIYGLPGTGTGSDGLHVCLGTDSPGHGTAPSGVAARLVEAFDVLPPGGANPDIFTYKTYIPGTGFQSQPTSWVETHLSSVAAVGIDLTFLPPVGGGRAGGVELGTTVQTTTFLRNLGCQASSPQCVG